MSSMLLIISENVPISSLVPVAWLSGAVPHGHKNPLWLGLASRLSLARCSLNAAGEHVALAAGLSRRTSNQVEDERHVPRIGTVERLAVALGASPSWLAFGHEGVLRFRERRPRSPLPPDVPEFRLAERPFPALHEAMGARLQMARQHKGLSLRALAAKAGISHQGVAFIEAGTTEARISVVEAIAKALDVAPGWLAFGEGEGPEAEEA